MKDKATVVNRIISIGILIGLALATFLVHTKVRLYGDDLHYFKYANDGLKYFWLEHYNHYFLANGRALVHFWVTVFVAIPMVFWRIINTFFIVSIASKIMDFSLNQEKEKSNTVLYGLLVVVTIISALDRTMTEQSVYWISGAFNYLYPLWLFVWFMHQYLFKNKSEVDYKVMLLGFFAACTVEQVGMMSIGLVVLTLAYKIYQNYEPGTGLKENIKWLQKKEWLLLLIVIFGAATVILAPSVFLRMTLEENNSNSTLELVLNNIFFQGGLFYKSSAMASVHVLTILAGSSVIFRRIGQGNQITKTEFFLIGYSLLSIIGLVFSFMSRVEFFNKLDLISSVLEHRILLPVLILGYFIFLTYTSVLVFKYKWIKYRQLPLIILILGFGSMMMLLVSPIFGYRNLLFMYFILLIYGVLLLQMKMNYSHLLLVCAGVSFVRAEAFLFVISILLYLGVALLRKWQWRHVFQKFSVVLLTFFVCSKLFLGIYGPYSANASSYDLNLELAENYKAGVMKTPEGEPIPLQLVILPYRGYRWTMPYDHSYYKTYYNMYLGIDPNTEIEWIFK